MIDRNQDSVVFQATFLEGGRQTRALFMSDIDHESIEQIVKTTKRHNNEDRLLWDIFKTRTTAPTRPSAPRKATTRPSRPMRSNGCAKPGPGAPHHDVHQQVHPVKGSDEDKDVQPPHRQAGAYYKRVANAKDGQFKVTMDLPSATSRSRPRSKSQIAAPGC